MTDAEIGQLALTEARAWLAKRRAEQDGDHRQHAEAELNWQMARKRLKAAILARFEQETGERN